MKLTTGILFLGMVGGAAWGQNPDVIENTRNTMKAVQQKKAMDSDAALSASPGSSANPNAAKPSSVSPSAPSASSQPKVARQASGKSASQPVSLKVKGPAGHKRSQPKQQIAVENQKKPAEAKSEQKHINLAGRRDPFISPVVNRSMLGSGCTSGKRCLTIDQINLKGVVKADTGMIAVVVNTLNKAYFLRENDPVFNGYVVRITGDSIIFKETVQDRLGKSFTREVTKKITTSAV
jgi:Tfp pilus assembly protein PilP